MKLSEQSEKLLLDILEEVGYRGYKSSRFYIHSSNYAESRVIAALGIESKLKASRDPDLVALGYSLKESKQTLLELLKDIVYEGKSQDVKGLAITEADIAATSSALVTSVALYRSLVPVGGRSGGFSDIVAYNVETRELITSNQMNMQYVANLHGVDLKDAESLPLVIPDFNPYILEPKFYGNTPFGTKGYMLNTYMPPKWRNSRGGGNPGLALELVDHLFPVESEKRYVLNWIKQAVLGRNETMLILVGARGIGKSLFSALVSGLVGQQYSQILDPVTAEDKFTGQLHNSRLGIFEEVAFGDTGGRAITSNSAALERMKAIMNARIKIEKKGADAFTASNYCSFMMTINPSVDLGVEPHERRFSIPRLTETDFSKVASGEDIARASTQWTSHDPDEVSMDELASFWDYVLENEDKGWSTSTPLKGEYYYDVTTHSMPQWKRYILNYLINEGELETPILMSDLRRKLKSSDDTHANGRVVSPSKIASFFGDYRHYGQYTIAKVVEDKSAWDSKRNKSTMVVPNTEFLKKFGAKYNVKEEKAEDIL